MNSVARLVVLVALGGLYLVHPALGFAGLAAGYGYAFTRRARSIDSHAI